MPLSDDQLGGLSALVNALGAGTEVWQKDREQRRQAQLYHDALLDKLRAEAQFGEEASQRTERRSIIHDLLTGYKDYPVQDVGNISAYLGAALENPGGTEATVRSARAAPRGGVGPAALPSDVSSLLRGYEALGGAKRIPRASSGGGQPKRFEDWWNKFVEGKQKPGGMFGAIQDIRVPSTDSSYRDLVKDAVLSFKNYVGGRDLTRDEVQAIKLRLVRQPGAVKG